VAVRGEHLSDLEAAWVLQCRTGGAPRACDHDRAVQLKPNADGTITTNLTVHAAFRSPLGDDVDCSRAGACSVVVSWGLAFVPDRFAQVPLTFGAPAPSPTSPPTSGPPVTGAELPRTGAPGATNVLAALGALLVAAGALVVLCCRPLRRSIRARPRAG
jgi:LPXTG-motif cell wall-anchored protein